jgi:predicted amidohydrolase
MLKICLAQILLEGGEPERNFERAKQAIICASKDKADIILLPECSDFSWTHPSSVKMAKKIPGEFSDFFSSLAKEYNIFICVGLTEKAENEKIYNSAILIDNYGKIILKYRKINILGKAKIYTVGNSLNVASTDIGNIGVNICSDNYSSSVCIGETLARMGADIILSPSSWTVDYSTNDIDPYGLKWKAPINYISKKYNLIFATVTSVGYLVGGPFIGRKMVGCSFLSINGDIVVEGKKNELSSESIYANFEINKNRILGVELSEKVKKENYVLKDEIIILEKNLIK